ncbi:recombinase family protein [Mycolicibacterium gilvum]|uniref:recombinase family protein n=1 Tax=Mycolicibacterium gilvum TaxID=1804 RepID=UPI0040461FC6
MPQSKPLRAIVGARVSVLQGPQKVSHLAQIESTTRWAEANGYEVVGSFEDLGVSAEKRPEDRPELGKWLDDEGAARWDAIVWSKMDRAFRSTRHCVDFARWAEERHKTVVFADDGLKLDYRPGAAKGIDAMMAELFVYLGSFFAQLELNRFKARASDSHRKLRQMDRWASGVPPLGFKVVDHPSGKGKGLDTDPEGKALIVQMAAKLLDGWSFIRIAAWCNESGHLTNMDRARIANGKPAKARPWTVNTVIDALTSPRTQGLKMTGRGKQAKTVLDGDGEPIRLGPPTFDADTWKQIQEAAQLRKMNRRTPTGSANPMLGVGICGCPGCPACAGAAGPICGASLAQQFTRKKLASGETREWRSYRCGRTPLNCNGVSMRAEDADGLLEETFLDRWGDEKVTRRVFVAGEDHSHELEQVNASIDRLRKESDAGLIVSAEDEDLYIQRMRSLIDRRSALEALPSRPAGWTTEETGHTYSEVWETADKRQLMVDHGVRFVLVSGRPLHTSIYRPDDGVPFVDISGAEAKRLGLAR